MKRILIIAAAGFLLGAAMATFSLLLDHSTVYYYTTVKVVYTKPPFACPVATPLPTTTVIPRTGGG